MTEQFVRNSVHRHTSWALVWTRSRSLTTAYAVNREAFFPSRGVAGWTETHQLKSE